MFARESRRGDVSASVPDAPPKLGVEHSMSLVSLHREIVAGPTSSAQLPDIPGTLFVALSLDGALVAVPDAARRAFIEDAIALTAETLAVMVLA